MGKYLKYLLPLIMALAFWNCTDKSGTAVDVKAENLIISDRTDWQSNISEPESKLIIPRKVSFASRHRTQTSARRTAGAQRNCFEFTRAGKIINADIRYSLQRKSITIHSSLAEPSQRLHRLGRLII